MTVDFAKLKALAPPPASKGGAPFKINKLDHVVLHASDLERSTRFYVEVLGFRISDTFPEETVPGGMVFMRFSPDHHGVALIGALKEKTDGERDLNHIAFEVSSLDEVMRARDHLKKHGVPVHFEGRRRAGCQIAVEFKDPDGHQLEIYWGIDQVGSDNVSRPASEWKGVKSLEEAIADPVVGQDTTVFG